MSFAVKVTMLRERTKLTDVRRFFGRIPIPRGVVMLINDEDYPPDAIAYVAFKSGIDREAALCKSGADFSPGRPVQVIEVSMQEYLMVRARELLPKEKDDSTTYSADMSMSSPSSISVDEVEPRAKVDEDMRNERASTSAKERKSTESRHIRNPIRYKTSNAGHNRSNSASTIRRPNQFGKRHLSPAQATTKQKERRPLVQPRQQKRVGFFDKAFDQDERRKIPYSIVITRAPIAYTEGDIAKLIYDNFTPTGKILTIEKLNEPNSTTGAWFRVDFSNECDSEAALCAKKSLPRGLNIRRSYVKSPSATYVPRTNTGGSKGHGYHRMETKKRPQHTKTDKTIGDKDMREKHAAWLDDPHSADLDSAELWLSSSKKTKGIQKPSVNTSAVVSSTSGGVQKQRMGAGTDGNATAHRSLSAVATEETAESDDDGRDLETATAMCAAVNRIIRLHCCHRSASAREIETFVEKQTDTVVMDVRRVARSERVLLLLPNCDVAQRAADHITGASFYGRPILAEVMVGQVESTTL